MSSVSRLAWVLVLLSGCGRSALLAEDPGFDADLGVFVDMARADMPVPIDMARVDMRDMRVPDLRMPDMRDMRMPDLRMSDMAQRDMVVTPNDIAIGPNDIAVGPNDIAVGPNDIAIGPTDIAVGPVDLAVPPPSDLAGCALNCNDGNPCTVDFCDAAGSCQHQPVGNGTLCNDGNLCTVNDRCFGGFCVPGTPLNCADGNTCTINTCNPSVGCVATPVPNGSFCIDADPCTVNDRCTNGMCVGQPRNCADNNPCTIDSCGPFGNCLHQAAPTGTSCNDNNACTTNDTCAPGAFCSGTPVPDGQLCGAAGSGCCVTGQCCQGPGCC
jgi:hypothetical protein